jgi:hypothetical protein
LRILACSPDHDSFAGLSLLTKLQHLSLEKVIEDNVRLFKVLRSCPKLQSLKLILRTFYSTDCELLAEAAPGLKTIDLSVYGHSLSLKGYARFLDVLPHPEAISHLPNGVLPQVAHSLPYLHSLSLIHPDQKTLLAIIHQCPNITRLFIFFGGDSVISFSPSVISASIRHLLIHSGTIVALPFGTIFPNVRILQIIPSSVFIITSEALLLALCRMFPNVEHFHVYLDDKPSSETVTAVRRQMKFLVDFVFV